MKTERRQLSITPLSYRSNPDSSFPPLSYRKNNPAEIPLSYRTKHGNGNPALNSNGNNHCQTAKDALAKKVDDAIVSKGVDSSFVKQLAVEILQNNRQDLAKKLLEAKIYLSDYAKSYLELAAGFQKASKPILHIRRP